MLHRSWKNISRGQCSNKMVHLHTGAHMFVGFWMQYFQTGGLGEIVQHPGHHDRRISHSLTSFYGSMLRTKCFRHQFQILQIWKAGITDAFATITEDMLENTWRETDCRLDVLRATKGAHVQVYWCVVKNFLSYILKKNFVFHVQ